MLQIVARGSPGQFWFKSVSKFTKKAAKKAARWAGNKDYMEKITGAFASYEADLRDDIQNVELALSAYRLRIAAEDSIYLAISLNGQNWIRSGQERNAPWLWSDELGGGEDDFTAQDAWEGDADIDQPFPGTRTSQNAFEGDADIDHPYPGAGRSTMITYL